MKLALAIVARHRHGRRAPSRPGRIRGSILDSGLRAAWTQQAGLEHGPVDRRDQAVRARARHPRARQRRVPRLRVGQGRCRRASSRGPRPTTKDDADDRDPVHDRAARRSRHDRRSQRRRRHRRATTTAIRSAWSARTPRSRTTGCTTSGRRRCATKARERWKAWLAWYREKGYRKDTPGTNYHAGYLFAATRSRSPRAVKPAPTARSCGARSPTRCGEATWRSRSPTTACSPAASGPRAGSTARSRSPRSAFAARAMRGRRRRCRPRELARQSVARARLRAHAGRRRVPGGDTEDETSAYVAVSPLTLDAIALGDASPDDKRWARGELSRLQLAMSIGSLFDALAGVGDKPRAAAARVVADVVRRDRGAHDVRAHAAGIPTRSGSSRSARRRSTSITATPTPATSRCRAARTT